MPDDEKEKDRSDPAAGKPRTERSFIDHLPNEPESPETPRAPVVPRDVEF